MASYVTGGKVPGKGLAAAGGPGGELCDPGSGGAGEGNLRFNQDGPSRGAGGTGSTGTASDSKTR